MARILKTVRVIPAKGSDTERIINERDFDSDDYDLTAAELANNRTEAALDAIAEAYRTTAGIPTYVDYHRRSNYLDGKIPTYETTRGVINHWEMTGQDNAGIKAYAIPDQHLSVNQVTITGYAVNDPGSTISAGDTGIPVDGGTEQIPAGASLIFQSHATPYTVASAQTGAGTLSFTPALTQVPADNETITVIVQRTISGYRVNDPVQQTITGYRVNDPDGDLRVSHKTMEVDGGTDQIPTGAHFTIAGQTTVYTVAQRRTGAGALSFSPGLTAVPTDNAALTITVRDLDVGDTAIPIDGGTGTIPAHSQLTFHGHATTYTVTQEYTGKLTISPGLVAAPADNAAVTVTYDTTVSTYVVDASSQAPSIGHSTMTIEGGTERIPANNTFTVAGHDTTYTVSQDYPGKLSLSSALTAVPPDNEAMTITYETGATNSQMRVNDPDGDLAVGDTTMSLGYGGGNPIPVVPINSTFTIAGHSTVYTIQQRKTGGGPIRFTPGLTTVPAHNAIVSFVYRATISDYVVNDPDGTLAAGDTGVPIDHGTEQIPVGAEVTFRGHNTKYIVGQQYPSTFSFTPGLTAVPADDAALTIAVKKTVTGYVVNDPSSTLAVGNTAVPVDGGSELIPANAQVTFAGGDTTTYTVEHDHRGTLSITPSLTAVPADNAAITVLPLNTKTIDLSRYFEDQNYLRVPREALQVKSVQNAVVALLASSGTFNLTITAQTAGTDTASVTVEDASQEFEATTTFRIIVT